MWSTATSTSRCPATAEKSLLRCVKTHITGGLNGSRDDGSGGLCVIFITPIKLESFAVLAMFVKLSSLRARDCAMWRKVRLGSLTDGISIMGASTTPQQHKVRLLRHRRVVWGYTATSLARRQKISTHALNRVIFLAVIRRTSLRRSSILVGLNACGKGCRSSRIQAGAFSYVVEGAMRPRNSPKVSYHLG